MVSRSQCYQFNDLMKFRYAIYLIVSSIYGLNAVLLYNISECVTKLKIYTTLHDKYMFHLDFLCTWSSDNQYYFPQLRVHRIELCVLPQPIVWKLLVRASYPSQQTVVWLFSKTITVYVTRAVSVWPQNDLLALQNRSLKLKYPV